MVARFRLKRAEQIAQVFGLSVKDSALAEQDPDVALVGAAEPGQAERLFREAGDLLPEGQAARVALGQLLDIQGNRRGAAAVLGLSSDVEQDPFIDPWVDYLLGVGNGPGQAEALRDEVRQ